MNFAFRWETSSTSKEARYGVSNVHDKQFTHILLLSSLLLLKLACKVYFVQSFATVFILLPNSLASHL